MSPRPKTRLSDKELLIISCVTQGMRNKEIAHEIGTTEQVVKNYLRKVYDKLGVADRLELALYCLNHRVVESEKKPAASEQSASTQPNSQISSDAQAAAASAPGKFS
jgi:DNA-binding CsgD family transcriptional regulator